MVTEPGAKQYFPVFLDITRRLVVIVGTGPLAEKRVRQFARYDADVVVIGVDPSPVLLEAQSDELVTLETRGYVAGDLRGAFLVMCVSDEPEVCQAVQAEAELLGCLLHVSGAQERSSFVLPSVFRHDALEVAVSTGGIAPPVAKAFRKWLAEQVGDEWAAWINLITEVRIATEKVEDEGHRRRAIETVSDPAMRDRLAEGEKVKASQIIAATEEAPQESAADIVEPSAAGEEGS